MLLNSHPKKRVVLIFTRQWKLLTHVLRMEKKLRHWKSTLHHWRSFATERTISCHARMICTTLHQVSSEEIMVPNSHSSLYIKYRTFSVKKICSNFPQLAIIFCSWHKVKHGIFKVWKQKRHQVENTSGS